MSDQAAIDGCFYSVILISVAMAIGFALGAFVAVTWWT